VSDSEPLGAPPRESPIAPGERAPAFRLPAIRTDGTQFDADMGALITAGPLLLVFYQDDGMPICTRELKAFEQEYDLLQEAGVGLLGMNTNGIGSHQRFQERDHFPFPLVSDFYGEAVKAYGLWDAGERKSRRAVVLINEDGTVKYVQPHFNPGNVNALVEVFEALGLV
jgi:peroxiredoxin Q/BCP